jgi:predicted ATPase/DNA-binding CsgD family transcriptional regulator
MSASNARCAACGTALPACDPATSPNPGGRPARHCSNACRQRAYRRRLATETRRDATGLPLLSRGLDTFIGRKRESAEVRRLLARHRLVTLIGSAGVGKTRLAVELAGRARPAFLDGVLWVDLAGVDRDEQVLPALRDAVGEPVRATRGRTDHSVLLVLDNCEQVVSGCLTAVAAILRDCSHIRVLATAREALGIPGEQIYPVRELALPEPREDMTPDCLCRTEAVRLFVDRARRADPGFTVTIGNMADVAAICRGLEGIPLGLELAAQRVRTLGVAGLRHLLAAPLDLTNDADRTVHPRHRSLRSAIEWSYLLLDPDEQAVWRRLSVLPGLFDTEIAVAVGAGNGLSAEPTLSVMGRLEAKSLLVSVPGADGSMSHRQPNLVRAYGRDLVATTGESDATQERLASHLAAAIEPHLNSFLIPPAVCAQITAREHQVLAAIDWLVSRDDARLAVLVCGLARSWLALGRNLVRSQDLLNDALARVWDEPDLTASLLAALCKAIHRHGNYAEQLRIGQDALALERTLDRPSRLASVLDLLAAGQRSLGQHREAYDGYARALGIVRALGDPAELSVMLNDLAWAALEWEQPDLAHSMLAEALPLARAHATPGRLASVLHTAGALALSEGDHDSAETAFVDALRSGNPADGLKIPYFLEGLGIALAAQDAEERGLSLIACAATIRKAERAVAEPVWQRQVQRSAENTAARVGTRRAQAATAAGSRIGLAGAAAYALGTSTHSPASSGNLLTQQEHTVAALVADGLTNEQIARQLLISARTVATHLERIRAKLGIRSRPAIATWFTRAGQLAGADTGEPARTLSASDDLRGPGPDRMLPGRDLPADQLFISANMPGS